MRPQRILSVGCDCHLMEVRSLLLRHSGYSVEEVSSMTEALQRLQSSQVDLLLVCHTLPTPDRKRLIAAAHARPKLLPVICLIAREGDGFANCINVENSPAALLESIATAAGFPPSRSPAQPRIRQG